MRKLLEHLQALSLQHGASLTHPSTLLAMSIESRAKHGDFSRGVLATVAEVYRVVSETPDGRQAIQDLGFEPFLQGVEGE